ncbi:MAG: AbgT family transporter [Romboutsia sp.]
MGVSIKTNNKKGSFFNRILNKIEVVGNKLPDPVTIFLGLCILVLIASNIIASKGVSVLHPGTNETVAVVNLLSKEQLQLILTNVVSNFQGFAPLGLVLVVMIGAGMCDKVGLMESAIKSCASKISGKSVTLVIMILGMLANLASDAGTILLPPLAAIAFLGVGRHPLIGLFAGYAAVTLGFSANIMISVVDVLIASFTIPAAQMMDPNYAGNATMNLYFMMASTVVLAILGTIITEKFIAPRFGEYTGNATLDVNSDLTKEQKKGLKLAGLSLLVCIGIIALLSIGGTNSFLADSETGDLLSNNAPFMKGMVPIMALLFFIPGIVYGKVTGVIKSDKDIVSLMGQSMSDMGSYIILAFAASQFLKLFELSNLGIVLSVSGAEFLKNTEISGVALIIGFIILSCIINLFIGSASAKWAIMAPIFVPMFMMLGYSPALTQMAYRIGDGITNPISPLFAYFPVILAFAKKYDKDAGMGTIMSNMIPYSISFLVVWSILLALFMIFGLPLGPGAMPLYTM